jgi:hypothetical protein
MQHRAKYPNNQGGRKIVKKERKKERKREPRDGYKKKNLKKTPIES